MLAPRSLDIDTILTPRQGPIGMFSPTCGKEMSFPDIASPRFDIPAKPSGILPRKHDVAPYAGAADFGWKSPRVTRGGLAQGDWVTAIRDLTTSATCDDNGTGDDGSDFVLSSDFRDGQKIKAGTTGRIRMVASDGKTIWVKFEGYNGVGIVEDGSFRSLHKKNKPKVKVKVVRNLKLTAGDRVEFNCVQGTVKYTPGRSDQYIYIKFDDSKDRIVERRELRSGRLRLVKQQPSMQKNQPSMQKPNVEHQMSNVFGKSSTVNVNSLNITYNIISGDQRGRTSADI